MRHIQAYLACRQGLAVERRLARGPRGVRQDVCAAFTQKIVVAAGAVGQVRAGRQERMFSFSVHRRALWKLKYRSE
jgi:hypothetical protein